MTTSDTATPTIPTATFTITQTDTPCPAAQYSPTASSTPPIVITELFSDGSGTGQWVELKNVGSATFNFANAQLCMGPGAYWAFSTAGAFSLSPGAFVVVHWNQTGTNTATDLFTGALTSNIVPGSGEMALYDFTNAFGTCTLGFNDPDCIVDYLEWGSTPHIRTVIAIQAGIWASGTFSPPMSGGLSLTLVPATAGSHGCHYALFSPSPGS